MPTTQALKRHAALVDEMAATLNIDLEEAVLLGQLEIDALTDAVLSCAECSDPDRCERWLAQQFDTVDAPPPMCRNTEMFDQLKP